MLGWSGLSTAEYRLGSRHYRIILSMDFLKSSSIGVDPRCSAFDDDALERLQNAGCSLTVNISEGESHHVV